MLGEVKPLGFNGNMSTGKVISPNARMKDYAFSIPIIFVTCQHVTQNCLLSLADYRRHLQSHAVHSFTGQNEVISAKGDDDVGSFVPDVQRTHLDVSTADADQNDSVFCGDHKARDRRDENETLDVLPLDYMLDTANPNDTKVSELADEQRADETLSGAFDFAKQHKGGYFVKNGLLFHRTRILDNFVERLVVPKERRRALLELLRINLAVIFVFVVQKIVLVLASCGLLWSRI